jgi:hypothetical protein
MFLGLCSGRSEDRLGAWVDICFVYPDLTIAPLRGAVTGSGRAAGGSARRWGEDRGRPARSGSVTSVFEGFYSHCALG